MGVPRGPVTTRRASLDTLGVTIQALHVDGKQMTLAVFRQLPEASLYQPDGFCDPAYELWGIVRYAMKDASDTWVVASRNGILFRAPLSARDNGFYRTVDEERAIAIEAQRMIGVTWDYLYYQSWKEAWDKARFRRWEIESAARDAARAAGFDGQQSYAAGRDAGDASGVPLDFPSSPEASSSSSVQEARERFQRARARLFRRRAAHWTEYALRELGQLYIAV